MGEMSGGSEDVVEENDVSRLDVECDCGGEEGRSWASEVRDEREVCEALERVCEDSEEVGFILFVRPFGRGMRTYLAHSSCTLFSMTKAPMSAVGAYMALNWKMSRRTRQP